MEAFEQKEKLEEQLNEDLLKSISGCDELEIDEDDDSKYECCITRYAHNDWRTHSIKLSEIKDLDWDYFGANYTSHREPRVYGYILYERAYDLDIIRVAKQKYLDYYTTVKVCVSLNQSPRATVKRIREIVGKRPPILPKDKKRNK